MATYTSHLNLKLPDYSDVADVKDLNDNFKKIDDAIASGGTGGGTGGITQETDPTVPSWAKQPNKPTYTAAEVGALPNTTVIPTVPTTLPNPQPIVINGVSYDGSEKKEITIQAEDGGIVTETDPTVPDWAKAANKPTYTAEEVGALPSTYEPPVMSVNGKTGAVDLVASDVGALPNTTVIPTVPDALKNPYPLTINGVAYDGSEAKTVTIESTGGGASVELDTTLTQYNKAADAGAVGNALAQEAAAREEAVNELKEAIDAQDTAIAKKANDADLAAVAKSGSYNDLTNKPTIPAAYTLPVASSSVLGGVKPAAKTDEMTQEVGVDANGQLFTVPGSGGGNAWKYAQNIKVTGEETINKLLWENIPLDVSEIVIIGSINSDGNGWTMYNLSGSNFRGEMKSFDIMSNKTTIEYCLKIFIDTNKRWTAKGFQSPGGSSVNFSKTAMYDMGVHDSTSDYPFVGKFLIAYQYFNDLFNDGTDVTLFAR